MMTHNKSSHSPDFNPLDIYLWVYLQPLEYAAPVRNKEAFRHHIVDACQTVCNYCGIFKLKWWCLTLCNVCTESHGGDLEQLLIKKLNISGHMLIKTFHLNLLFWYVELVSKGLSTPLSYTLYMRKYGEGEKKIS
jgi:hypothetical protein